MMDLTEQVKEAALGGKKLGLLNGKLGASVYFFAMSDHDEESDAFKTASMLVTQVYNGTNTVRNIDLDGGMTGISLGVSFLVGQGYLKDTLGAWRTFVDSYIYRVATRVMDMTLKGKDLSSMVELLAYEAWRYSSLGEGAERQLHGRFIARLLNHVYMDRPADFYSEAMPFKVRDRLVLFLLTLVEVRGMGLCVERIDRILGEMQPFLFSLRPILHPNRYCLFLASSLVAQATGSEGWRRYAEDLEASLDMGALLTRDLFDMSVLLSNGVLGIALLTWWYNRKSSVPVRLDMDALMRRFEKSTFWERLSHDGIFLRDHYSLDGYCGIKLWQKLMGGK